MKNKADTFIVGWADVCFDNDVLFTSRRTKFVYAAEAIVLICESVKGGICWGGLIYLFIRINVTEFHENIYFYDLKIYRLIKEERNNEYWF